MEQESLVTQIALLAIENSATSIVVTDPVGTLLYVNPMFERMTGYKGTEVGGRPCSFLQYDPDGRREEQPGLNIVRQAMRDGRAATTRLSNYRKSGERFIVELTISPLFDNRGDVIGFVGVQQDITERVRGEQAVLENAVSQATMDMLREIFGDFNHELRHPLSRIGVATHLVRKFTEAGKAEQALDVTRNIDHEIGIMRVMLDRFSHLQKLYGRKRHEPRRVAITDILESEITIFQGRHSNITLETDFDPDVPQLWLDVDEIGLMTRELLDNMTVHNTNAVKRVRVSLDCTRDTVFVRFTNNGPPIAEDNVQHLFRPFFRGDRSRTADATRVGLGLSLAARIAEIHSGRLYLETTNHQGSTFTVELPVEMPTMDASASSETQSNIALLTQEIAKLVADSD